MSDNHQEAYADFPTGILAGAIAMSFVVSLVLGVFTFGMGGHGATMQQAANTPAATQQNR